VQLVILVLAFQTFVARGTIVYTGGQSFYVPNYSFFPIDVDLNQDGTADVAFSGNSIIGIGGPLGPGPGVYSEYYFANALNGAAIYQVGTNFDLQILENGDVIDASLNWAAGFDYIAGWSHGVSTNSGGTGELSIKRQGYFGLQIPAADGEHYGWMEVRLVNSEDIEFTPLIVDWAYESIPNKPIVAGARPVYYSATFPGTETRPPFQTDVLGGGIFSLETNADGCHLSYEVQLQPTIKPGRAAIYIAPTAKTGPGRLLANLGMYAVTNAPPIIQSSAGNNSPGDPQSILLPFLIYHGEMTLTSEQVKALSRGQLFVDITYGTRRPNYLPEETKARILPRSGKLF
jgi:hypothetical protein